MTKHGRRYKYTRSYRTKERVKQQWIKALVMIYFPLITGLSVGYLIALQIT